MIKSTQKKKGLKEEKKRMREERKKRNQQQSKNMTHRKVTEDHAVHIAVCASFLLADNQRFLEQEHVPVDTTSR